MTFKPSYPRYQSNNNYSKHQTIHNNNNNNNYNMYNSINRDNNSNYQQYNNNMSKTGGKQNFQTHRVFNEDFIENDYNNNYSKK
jgi:hypothetical protein